MFTDSHVRKPPEEETGGFPPQHMHVLILGAHGMLGRALKRAFATDEVVAWDREDLDITDARAVATHVPAAEPDVVINAAAYTNVEQAEDEPAVAAHVNGEAVGFLAKTCAARDIPLLHVSTDYVFGSEQEAGYTEEDIPRNPVNSYGRSKLLGEHRLQEHGGRFWLLRTSWVFGPYGNHFVDTILRIGTEKREVRVVGDQYGSPAYSRDVAQGISALINDHASFGIYHLTNSGITTWADFAKTIFTHARMPVTVIPIRSEEYAGKAKRPRYSILKNTKRPPLRSWEEALKDYLTMHHLGRP